MASQTSSRLSRVIASMNNLAEEVKHATRPIYDPRDLLELIVPGPALLHLKPQGYVDEDPSSLFIPLQPETPVGATEATGEQGGKQKRKPLDHDADYNDEEGLVEDAGDPAYASDFDSTTQPGGFNVVVNDTETTLVEWLNSLNPHIYNFHAAAMPRVCQELRPFSIPYDYQWKALGMINFMRKSPHQGIFIADPPGVGKTLPAAMATVMAKKHSQRNCFSLIVAPSSILGQWEEEFESFFKPGTVSVCLLRDSNTSAHDLLQYDVVLTSYSFVQVQYRKWNDYLDRVAAHTKKFQETRVYDPINFNRPSISILSEIFMDGGLFMPYLVMDEVNAVKNCDSATYKAMEYLRTKAKAVIMLAGDAIDNTWPDLYAISSFLKGHPFHNRDTFISAFTKYDPKKPYSVKPPKATGRRRLVHWLQSFTLRRPEKTNGLPPLRFDYVKFDLNKSELAASNAAFAEFAEAEKKKKAVAKKNAARGRGRGNRRSRIGGGARVVVTGRQTAAACAESKAKNNAKWSSFMEAQQHASHPELVTLMASVYVPRQYKMDGEASGDRINHARDHEEWDTWKHDLRQDCRWTSTRILAIIDKYTQMRDLDPQSNFLIFSESVYFLDILEIAFEEMDIGTKSLRFDGRDDPEKRLRKLKEFSAPNNFKPLLISRPAGGLGLNIVKANVVFICEAWWKESHEMQAAKRSWRKKQRRIVTLVRFQANGCFVEAHKKAAMSKKSTTNQEIVRRITKEDSVPIKVRSRIK